MLDNKKKYVVLEPMKKPVDSVLAPCYPYSAYCTLVCEIPYGMVAIDEEIEHCLEEAYGIEGLKVETPTTYTEDRLNFIYPYWRVVSKKGHLLNRNGKETQKSRLEEEGHEVYDPNPDWESYAVRDYTKKKFDFASLNITVRTDPEEYVKKAENFYKK